MLFKVKIHLINAIIRTYTSRLSEEKRFKIVSSLISFDKDSMVLIGTSNKSRINKPSRHILNLGSILKPTIRPFNKIYFFNKIGSLSLEGSISPINLSSVAILSPKLPPLHPHRDHESLPDIYSGERYTGPTRHPNDF